MEKNVKNQNSLWSGLLLTKTVRIIHCTEQLGDHLVNLVTVPGTVRKHMR